MNKFLVLIGLLTCGCAANPPIVHRSLPPERIGLYNGLAPSQVRAESVTKRLAEELQLKRTQLPYVYDAALGQAHADRELHWKYDTSQNTADRDSLEKGVIHHWEDFCAQLQSILTHTQYEQYLNSYGRFYKVRQQLSPTPQAKP